MKQIPLTKNQFALVDNDDYYFLNQFKWSSTGEYALRREGPNVVYMHRVIMKTPPNLQCDHISGNTFDNRKSNLRNCPSRLNTINRKNRILSSSKYKGVRRDRYAWRASITTQPGKHVEIGSFKDEHHAALAYDLWAIDIYGPFAKTNFTPLTHS